jgi:hypothetical protein
MEDVDKQESPFALAILMTLLDHTGISVNEQPSRTRPEQTSLHAHKIKNLLIMMIYSILLVTFIAVAGAQPSGLRGGPFHDNNGDHDGQMGQNRTGSHGGPEGRGGPGGPFDDLFPMDFTNITCSEVDPICTGPRGEDGTWVCRTLHHPVTTDAVSFSTCIDPERSVETDTCGCCNDECPEMCTCSCGYDGGGVLVQKDDSSLCVPPPKALHLISLDDEFSCVTECPN